MASDVKIKITAAAELSALKTLEDSLSKQIVTARALGKDYKDLEKDLQRVQKAMADIKPPTALQKGWGALKEGIQELPFIGAFSRAFNGTVPLVGGMLLAAGALKKVAEGFAEGVLGAAAYADKMGELGARTGQSVSDAVIITQAFKNEGLDAANVGQAINMLQMALTGLNEEGLPTKGVFDNLGLSLEALKDMSPINALQAISEKISGLGSAADKTRAVKDLFGRSGASLLPLLGNAEAFSTAKTQVGELADMLGTSTKKLGDFADAMESMKDRAKLEFFAGFARAFASDMGKAAESINQVHTAQAGLKMGDILRGTGSTASDVWKDMNQSARKFMEMNPEFQQAITSFNGLLGGIFDPVINIGRVAAASTEYVALRNENERRSQELDEKQKELEEKARSSAASKEKRAAEERARIDNETLKRRQEISKGLAGVADAERLKSLPLNDQKAELDKRAASMDAYLQRPNLSKEDYETSSKLRIELEKQRLDVASKITEELKKASDLEKENSSKREALDLELSIKEAQAAGNKDLVAKLQWQKEYSALLKAGVDAKDPDAWNKARRGANASMEDPLATAREIEKQARSAAPLSSLGRLGMAMGENSNASATISKLQELITSQQKAAVSLNKIEKNTTTMANKPGGYQ